MHALQHQRQPARSVSEYGAEVSELYEGVWVRYRVKSIWDFTCGEGGIEERRGKERKGEGAMYDMHEELKVWQGRSLH